MSPLPAFQVIFPFEAAKALAAKSSHVEGSIVCIQVHAMLASYLGRAMGAERAIATDGGFPTTGPAESCAPGR